MASLQPFWKGIIYIFARKQMFKNKKEQKKNVYIHNMRITMGIYKFSMKHYGLMLGYKQDFSC